MNHTPGPWTTAPRGTLQLQHVNAGGKTIAQVWDFPEAEANARLLAAAPELLERLKEVLSLWDDPCPYDANTTRAAARALLAKVTS